MPGDQPTYVPAREAGPQASSIYRSRHGCRKLSALRFVYPASDLALDHFERLVLEQAKHEGNVEVEIDGARRMPIEP